MPGLQRRAYTESPFFDCQESHAVNALLNLFDLLNLFFVIKDIGLKP
jgi:hypothetical protein